MFMLDVPSYSSNRVRSPQSVQVRYSKLFRQQSQEFRRLFMLDIPSYSANRVRSPQSVYVRYSKLFSANRVRNSVDCLCWIFHVIPQIQLGVRREFMSDIPRYSAKRVRNSVECLCQIFQVIPPTEFEIPSYSPLTELGVCRVFM